MISSGDQCGTVYPCNSNTCDDKNMVVTVIIMLSPDFLQPLVMPACFLEVGVPIHTINTGSVPGQGPRLVGYEQKYPFTQTGYPPASQSEPYIANSATCPPPHSHGSSPEHVKVAAVDAVRASYHSFLDCYTVPKFGMLRSHRISKHLPRQPKAMSFQNKSNAFMTVTGGLLNLSCLSGGTGGSSETSLGTV